MPDPRLTNHMSKSLKFLDFSLVYSYYPYETASRPLYMITAQKATKVAAKEALTVATQKATV